MAISRDAEALLVSLPFPPVALAFTPITGSSLSWMAGGVTKAVLALARLEPHLTALLQGLLVGKRGRWQRFLWLRFSPLATEVLSQPRGHNLQSHSAAMPLKAAPRSAAPKPGTIA